MPYSGGSSTQAGIAYQNWYLALLISYAFFEVDHVIYPEILTSKTIIVDDIVVTNRLGIHCYSAKFRSPSKTLHWDQNSLNSQNIFTSFKKQHEANPKAKIILVSESNCYLFAEVFKRARNAETPYHIDFALDSDYVRNEWEKAKQNLQYSDSQLINFAKQVEILCIPLIEIKNLIKHRFHQFGHHNSIRDLFYHKAGEYSSNKSKINKIEINRWFDEEEIYFNTQ